MTNWKRPIASSPKTRSVAARLALAYFQRGAKKEAEELAAEALKLQPKQQLATYVLVRLQKAGTPQEAMAKLESCLDRKAPEPLVLNLLAGLKLKAEKYDEAAELYALGERLDPANPQWTAGRARVYLAADQKQNLARALVRFAQIEPDDLPSRKKLAELALERREAAVARRWATEALEIQVEDADAHRLLAAALVELNELDRAIEEFEAAIETQSGQSSAAIRPGRRPASGQAAGQGEKGPGRTAPPRPQIPRGRHPAGKPREETLE